MKLKISIADVFNNKIFCRVTVSQAANENREMDLVILQTVYCDGNYEFEFEKGQYELEIKRGKLYNPFKEIIKILEKDVELDVILEEIVDTKGLNLYSFDAHSHVSRDEVLETGNLVTASTIMKGEDFNLFFAGSPYDHDVHLQYLNKNFTDKLPYRDKFKENIEQVSNKSYMLDIGNETVKCRYGHAFMMNYLQKPPFSKYYDEEWDPWLFTKVGEEPAYSIAYMHEALLKERGENSIATSAHPTSWWYHDNGEFITNIASTLGFEILAGSIDAMVVMGYARDHKYYQELWFDALKNGYFLPGIAETDASFDNPPERILEFKTYAITTEFSIDAICNSVREGRCIVSSGPIILMKVNGKPIGSVLKYFIGESFDLDIEAYRCYEAPLSKMQVLVNGKVYKQYDLCEDSIKKMDSIVIEKDSFIIIKCYDAKGNLAMTNPVYIRNTPFLNRGYMSNISLKLSKAGEAAIGVYWLDENDERKSFNEIVQFKMKPSSKLYVEVQGRIKIVNLFELPELQEIFKNLYLGSFNSNKFYKPGEVPAKEFKLSRIRGILNNLEIKLEF